MEIVTLIENKSMDDEEFHSEHGLSLFIRVDGKNILFDTGQSGNFIDNARKLDIDLKELDYVIISHGHYDHSGGLERLIEELKPQIKLFLGRGFFNKKYRLLEDGDYEYIGNPFDEDYLKDNNIDFQYISQDTTYLTENLIVFTNFARREEFENINDDMYIELDGEYKKDLFLDEISLGVKTDEGLVLLVGCSHVGIVNIIDSVFNRSKISIRALIGGTHLVKESDEQINSIIDYLKEKEIGLIGACHCTGRHGETMLGQQLEEEFIDNNSGNRLKF